MGGIEACRGNKLRFPRRDLLLKGMGPRVLSWRAGHEGESRDVGHHIRAVTRTAAGLSQE